MVFAGQALAVVGKRGLAATALVVGAIEALFVAAFVFGVVG